MKIDVSFGWQQGDKIADNDSGNATQAQDQGEYEITQPVAILKLVADTPHPVAKNEGVDPYDNDYWTKIPLQ